MDPFLFTQKNPLFDPNARQDSAYKKRPRDPDKSAKYTAQTPEPNYSEFGKKGIEYVDLKGREYRLAKGELVENYVKTGDITKPGFTKPDRELKEQLGTQVFWIRIPIHLRGTVVFPDPDGEHLELYYASDQIVCRGKTDGVFVSGQKKKTGFIVLRDFTTFGQVADPSPYEHLVDKEKQIKRRKTLF